MSLIDVQIIELFGLDKGHFIIGEKMTLQEKLTETIQYIHNQGVKEVEFGLILGSCLG